jgi:hypothetical protein
LVSEDNGALLPVDASAEEVADTLHRFASLSKADVQKMRTAAIETWEAKANADRQYSEFAALLSQM